MKKIILFFILTIIPFLTIKAEGLTEYAKSAVLIEPTTNTIIYELNKDEQRAPASMTKLMTLLIIMENIDNGKISLSDKVLISKNAASMGGSQVFLQENMEIEVEQLIKSIAIASGNDAAVAMAEYIGGTTEDFVGMMNEKVSELGLQNTHFVNVHGLDAENHYSSAYDMSQIARELLKHPTILNYTSLYEDYLNKPDGSKTWLVNTNKLVRFYNGVDGLKTGYTGIAGYCLTATALKNNIRFVSVVMGEPTSENRSSDTTSLLNYGFSNYRLNTILTTSDVIGESKVKRGKQDTIQLIPLEDVTDLIKQNEKKDYTYKINKKDLVAPVNKGDIVGNLEVIDNNGKLVKSVNITVLNNVEKHSFVSLFMESLKKLLTGI